jgi:hypothetical protein
VSEPLLAHAGFNWYAVNMRKLRAC